MWSGRSLPTFLMNLLSPSSGQLVVIYKAARCDTPKQRTLHTTNIFGLLSPQWRHNCTSTCLLNSLWQADPYIIRKGKGQVRPRTGYQGHEVIGGGQRHTPAAFPPGKARYSSYRRLCGPKGWSGRMRKISPELSRLTLQQTHRVTTTTNATS